MKLTVFHRSYRFRQPFRTSGWSMESREVLLLHIASADGAHTGWGECAPLPAFGTETLAEAEQIVSDASAVLAACRVSPHECTEDLDAALPGLARSPAARFALESALLDLEARSRGMSVADFLGGQHRSSIPVNAVIGGGPPGEAARLATEAVREGFRCLKMKVGGGDLEHDLDRLRAVRSSVDPSVSLRLDANGAWDFGEAEEALRAFIPYDVEYIEQPVAAEAVDELAALTGMNILPIAADEAAHSPESVRVLLERRAAHVLVIKPMAMGGLRLARECALLAREYGVDVVFTSLIDSSVGRHAVAQLCASLPDPLRPQGLATGRLFAEDSGRDVIVDGTFALPTETGLGMTPVLEGA